MRTQDPEREVSAAAPDAHRDHRLAWIMVVAGAVAFLASSMLVYERLQIYVDAGHTSSCDINSLLNCGTVMRTSQAQVFGFPNPFIGIVAYGLVLAIGTAILAGARSLARWYWWCVQIGVTLGFCFICWLWFQTTFEIDALCLYCMIVWIMQTMLFFAVTARNLRAGVIPASEQVADAFGGWWVFLTAVVLLVIFGIIVIRFFAVIMAMF